MLVSNGQGTYAAVMARVKSLPVDDRKQAIRDYIDDVEYYMLCEVDESQKVEPHIEDWLSEGLYIRTMYCPANTILTGATHKHSCITIVSKGSISVLTENGCALIKAPCVFPAAAGIRRLGHTHENTIWSTIHSVKGTTLEEIEEELFQDDYLEAA